VKQKNINFKKDEEKLGFRTPSRFMPEKFQKRSFNPNIKQPFTARPRALGGHR